MKRKFLAVLLTLSLTLGTTIIGVSAKTITIGSLNVSGGGFGARAVTKMDEPIIMEVGETITLESGGVGGMWIRSKGNSAELSGDGAGTRVLAINDKTGQSVTAKAIREGTSEFKVTYTANVSQQNFRMVYNPLTNMTENRLVTEKVIGFADTLFSITVVDDSYSVNTDTKPAADENDKVNVKTIEISTASDLKKMEGSHDNFVLTKDINLKGINWKPVQIFYGTLDGKGYKIMNLTGSGGGLFDTIDGAVVKNLIMYNVNITSDMCAGTIARWAELGKNPVRIENCGATGKIELTSPETTAAGLISNAYGSKGITFKDCYNKATVKSVYVAGGICGNGEYSSFINCVNGGVVTGDYPGAVGGIVGYAKECSVFSCFNYGKVTNNDSAYKAGGILGYLDANGIIDVIKSASILDSILSYSGKYAVVSEDDNKLASPLSVFKKASSYGEFDFNKIWYIDPKINNGYPVLQSMLALYTASKPTPSVKDAAVLNEGTKVSFKTDLNGVTLYYTTNGKNPTSASKKYTGAITVNKNMTIKIAAITNNGKKRGSILTVDYIVK